MANRKYHRYLLFATHSHASEIFPYFLRELNLEGDNFRDVSRGLNILNKKNYDISRGTIFSIAEQFKIGKI